MFRYKAILILLCTCNIFVLSTDNPVTRAVLKLDEVENRPKLTLDKFLAAASEEYITSVAPEMKDIPIVIKDCLPGSILQLVNIKVKPTELIKGKPISMLAAGVLKEERDITNLHIEAYYEGNIIFKNDVDRKEHANKGPYNFSYNNDVPTFTPSGHWETYVWLIGAGDEKLACIEATFDT